MPRKPLLYTHEQPYHICARANNKEWFYLPISECWPIFTRSLSIINDRFGFEVHAFVLMNNHYHLLGQCSSDHDLGEVMAWFQKSVSRKINLKSGRINHIFGGPYKASLIRHPFHYSEIYKYVARNPVAAGLSKTVEAYPYSTFNPSVEGACDPRLICSLHWRDCIPRAEDQYLKWLNTEFEVLSMSALRVELKKTLFNPIDRSTRRDPFITQARYQK